MLSPVNSGTTTETKSDKGMSEIDNGEARPMTAREGSSMTAHFYAVQFLNVGGSWEHSRFFDTVRAARSWARWLMTRPNVVEVKVARGGHGGEPVAV